MDCCSSPLLNLDNFIHPQQVSHLQAEYREAAVKCVTEYQKKGSENMSEKEKKIVETISKAVSEMSDFDKGYLLGMGEAMVNSKKKKEGGSVERSNDNSGDSNSD